CARGPPIGNYDLYAMDYW
nr:immunoglobulin heavy chain junction region [Mus musculus]